MRLTRIAGCALALSGLLVACAEQPTALEDVESGLFAKGGKPGKPGGGDGAAYSVRDLGALVDSAGSAAYDINEDGVIVGSSRPYGFVWTETAGMQRLDPLVGGEYSRANGINDAGWIVGYTGFPNDWASHGTLWTPDGNGGYDPIALEEPTSGPGPGTPGSNAEDLNNVGQIVGSKFDGGGTVVPVIWDANGVIERELARLSGGQEAWVRAINDAGQAVGASYVSSAADTLHAVLWLESGELVDLTPGAYSGQAWDITEPDGGTVEITGEVLFRVDGGLAIRALVWTVQLSNRAVTADTLPQGRYAYALNAAGYVVGLGRIKNNNTSAVVWTPARELIELPCLSKGKAVGCSGRAITNGGVVAGSSMMNWNTPSHAVLWTKK